MELKANVNFKIEKETEKAVAIWNVEKEELSDYLYNVGSHASKRDYDRLYELTDYIWLPKTQITIENGFVVDMAEWLAKKYGFTTEKMVEDYNNAFANGCAKYEKALAFAKENGLKVRNKMKLKNILAEIENAGLKFEF